MLFNPLDVRKNHIKRSDLIATVVNNDDSKHPDKKKRGRVQIRIPILHRNVPDDKLPWSMPHSNGGQANAGAGSGSVRIPPNGAKVFVTQDEEDPHNPRYGMSPTTDDVNEENELNEEDYPHTYGEVDQAGNMWKVNTKKNTKTTTHVSGTTEHVDGDGNHSLFGKGNIDEVATGNIVKSAKGNISNHSKGNHSIKGAKVMINCSDGFANGSAGGNRTKPNIKDPSGKNKA